MVCSFTILELSLFTNWFALLGPFEMGRWSPGITCQDVSKRHIIHGRVLAVIASIFVAKTIWFGAATASVIWSVHPTKVNQENHTNHVDSMEQQLDDVGHASIFQVDMELRIRQFQRRRLIRILNQFTNMRKNQRVIRELANQGPDGSHLVNQSISPVEVETTGPPPELAQLLVLEARIRRLRHLRRILLCKKGSCQKSTGTCFFATKSREESLTNCLWQLFGHVCGSKNLPANIAGGQSCQKLE